MPAANGNIQHNYQYQILTVYVKANAYNSYIETQAAYCSCRGTVVSQTLRVYNPIGSKLSSRPRTLTCIQTATRSPGLPF